MIYHLYGSLGNVQSSIWFLFKVPELYKFQVTYFINLRENRKVLWNNMVSVRVDLILDELFVQDIFQPKFYQPFLDRFFLISDHSDNIPEGHSDTP